MNAKTALEAKVMARNRLNSLVRYWVPNLQTVLQTLRQQKVWNTTGGAAPSLRKALEPWIFPNSLREQVAIRSDGSRRIYVHFKTSEQYPCKHGGELAVYAEDQVELARLEGAGVLADIADFNPNDYPTNYSVAQVKMLRLQATEATIAYRQAMAAIQIWGQHDN